MNCWLKWNSVKLAWCGKIKINSQLKHFYLLSQVWNSTNKKTLIWILGYVDAYCMTSGVRVNHGSASTFAGTAHFSLKSCQNWMRWKLKKSNSLLQGCLYVTWKDNFKSTDLERAGPVVSLMAISFMLVWKSKFTDKTQQRHWLERHGRH